MKVCERLFIALAVLLFSSFQAIPSFALYLFQSDKQTGAAYEVKPKSSSEDDIGTVNIALKAKAHNALFTHRRIKYKIKATNTYKETQEGDIGVTINTDKGVKVLGGSYPVTIAPKGLKSIKTKFPLKEPGFYEYLMSAHLTSYDDSIRTVFGYNPLEINTPLHKPDDFDAFWQQTKEELEKIDPQYEVEQDKALSNSSHRVYLVKMKSLEGVIIHGWLTVPRVGGHYPVLLGLPGYKVILKPLYADDFVTLQLNIRKSKSPREVVTDAETDYTLYGIDSKEHYIYRGAYMDCIRAIDFICSHRNLSMDSAKIAVAGGSQGGAMALVVAGLDKRVKACITDNPIYCDIHNNIEISAKRTPVEWPINRYREYLQRTNQYDMRGIIKVMDYFDPQNFVSNIHCPVLLGLGLLDKLAPPACIFATYNKLPADAKANGELYTFSDLGHEVSIRHRKFQNLWMLEQLNGRR